jgi:pyruvate,orthophosphate dikinase
MANLGLPVPPGFTITTEVCTYYYANGKTYPGELKRRSRRRSPHRQVCPARSRRSENPLLVSVRSGARASMPGMMDTVLNLGLNDDRRGAGEASGDPASPMTATAASSRCIRTSCSARPPPFRGDPRGLQGAEGLRSSTPTSRRRLKELVGEYKDGEQRARPRLPAGPARPAVGRDRRRVRLLDEPARHHLPPLHDIPESWGTAVNVQAMVFGNMGETSATGVAFTRNPSTGENALYGEFLVNAQGEDVVAGIRTPQDLTEAARIAAGSDKPSMEEAMPEAFTELVQGLRRARAHYRDMQDIEFTVEQGKLWMLQTRSASAPPRRR